MPLLPSFLELYLHCSVIREDLKGARQVSIYDKDLFIKLFTLFFVFFHAIISIAAGDRAPLGSDPSTAASHR